MAAGIITPSGALTAADAAKLAALPLPNAYDDGRALIARSLPALPASVALAINAGSSMVDVSASAHTLVPTGAVAPSTTQKWAGGYSIYFDGAGDWLSIAPSTDFNLAGNDFDIRVAVFLPADDGLPNENDLIGLWEDAAGTCSWLFAMRSNGAYQDLEFMYSLDGTNLSIVQRSVRIDDYIAIGQWHHLRAARFGDVLTLWVDEYLVYAVAMTDTIYTPNPAATVELTIGAITGGYGFFYGFMGGIFIQNGGTVTSGEFVVDRNPFPTAASVVYQPEQTLLPKAATVRIARELSPVDGEHAYIFDGAYSVQLKPMVEWGGWTPNFFARDGIGTVILYAGDQVDGSGSNIIIPVGSQCKLRKDSSTTAISEGNFYRP